MISLPDLKNKQILFVKADWGVPSCLRFINDNIVFEKDKKIVNRVSIHKTISVFISGDLALTTNFIRKAKEYGVSIFFLKNNLSSCGELAAQAEGHYLLRMKQYSLTEEQQLILSKKLVKNKITNQFTLLLSKTSSSEEKNKLKSHLSLILSNVDMAEDFQEVLGLEGNVSKDYFKTYFHDFNWYRRAPRTKEDITNLLMDMGYTFLFNFVDSLLRLHGFDTYKGFYHRLFFQRRSLACDIMEPFRCLIDKKILKSHNLQQINEKDFKVKNRAYELPFAKNHQYANLFLESIMNKKEDIFLYIQSFYRHIMNPDKYEFPFYKLK